MSNPPRPIPFVRRPPEDAGRLDSWKEIAAYLDREVRTVQGWEKNEALPIHRHQHSKQGSVYAFKAELDAWRDARKVLPETPAPALPPLILTRRVPWAAWLGAAVLTIVVVAGGIVWKTSP